MKTTMKQQLQAKQDELMGGVCALLKTDRAQINTMMFNVACSYIEELAAHGPIASEFLASPAFWAWWRQQWSIIDEAFINQARDSKMTRDVMLAWYENMHREIDTYPDAVIWEKIHGDYMTMATKIIKKHMA